MKIVPMNETEYSMRNVWPKGTYPCHINKAEEGNSQKSGDPFFKFEVQIFNESDNYRTIKAFVMAAGKAQWQLRSAVEAFGLLDKYHNGSVEAFDFEGKDAFAKVGVEEDKSGVFDPKNVIREFTNKAPKAKEVTASTDGPPPGHPAAAPIDDSIPF